MYIENSKLVSSTEVGNSNILPTWSMSHILNNQTGTKCLLMESNNKVEKFFYMN